MITKEDDNFLRIVYLHYRVGTTALRRFFDRLHPNLPSDLSSQSNKAILSKLYNRGPRKVLYQDQWNILYPSPGSPVVSSADLDVTLMICLLRSLPPSVIKPAYGFEDKPDSNDSSDGAQIARIKYYKNFIVSHSKDGKLSDTDFKGIWIDLEMAIHGLGNQQDVKDAADAKSICLDYKALKELVNVYDSIQRNLKRINNNSNKIAVHSSKITKLETTVENIEKETKEHSDLKKKIMKMETEQAEVIPKNIRDQIEKQIKDWEKKDELFVTTRASKYVIECLQENSCLTLTAPSGVGKSFIARHTALFLQNEGYNIVPVRKPDDFENYYQPGKQTVFIVDDICGNFTANQQQIETWKQLLPVINRIIADKCCKIIVSCRLQVYKDDKFNILIPFKSCECNLISDKLCLTPEEKNAMATNYIGSSLDNIDNISQNVECFPLLCSLYHAETHGNVKDFFTNPFTVYEKELDSLRRQGDEGNYKICSLALLVLFNNQLAEQWLQGKVTDEQIHILEDTCEACRLNRSTSKAELKEALLTLDGTFVHKQNGIYRTLHDKLFDFLANYFGQKMIGCLIDHGDSALVHERFIWKKTPDGKNSKLDFIIDICDDYLETYFKRFVMDWSAGKVKLIFCNNNMKVPHFRTQLLQYLKQLYKSKQVTLSSTQDTLLPKEHQGSGTYPLVCSCVDGHTDMVQWILQNDVDVDQCRDDKATALNMASQNGHTDIVNMLLEMNPNVDSCDIDGSSPLIQASQNGHFEIVKLLLERNPNINLCDNNRCCPLYVASQQGYTDIVNVLLKRNPNVDLRNYNGCSPLYIASQQGHTDIVKLLLEQNPNVDLCDVDGWSPLRQASKEGHTDIVRMLLERNPDVNLCDRNGCSPLYMASQQGHTDIIKLLLERDPNVDLRDKNGCSSIIIAIEQGHTDIVRLLLEKNPNYDVFGHDMIYDRLSFCRF